jgi:thiol-disulfide isomerase/thioredoxin
MSKVLVITNREQYIAFKETHRRGIIFYSAEWCSACKEIEPLYTRIATRYHDRIAMAYIDIDVCGLEFSTVPVFVSFYEGTQLNSLEGADNDGLKSLVKEAIEHDHHKASTPIDSPLMTEVNHLREIQEEQQHYEETHQLIQSTQRTTQPIQSAHPIKFDDPIQFAAIPFTAIPFTEFTPSNAKRPIIVRIPSPEPIESALPGKVNHIKIGSNKTSGPKIQNDKIRNDLLTNIKNNKKSENDKKSKNGVRGYIEVIT